MNKYHFEKVNGGTGYDIIDWFKNKVCWCLHLHDAESCVNLLNEQSSHLRLFKSTIIQLRELRADVWVEAEDIEIAGELMSADNHDHIEWKSSFKVIKDDILHPVEVTK